jgi:hypothetical protein
MVQPIPLRRTDALSKPAASEISPPPPPRVKATPRLTAEEREFLPATVELVETPFSPTLRLTAWALCGLIAAAVIWASLAHIDMVAVADGEVVPLGQVKVVQPLETAMIRAIHVDEGDHVAAGQLLVDLDPTEARADLDALVYNRIVLSNLEKRQQSRQDGLCLLASACPRQNDLEFSEMPGLRLHFDGTAVLFHNDIVAHRQAKSCAFTRRFRCKERSEYFRFCFGWDPGAVVADANFDRVTEILRHSGKRRFEVVNGFHRAFSRCVEAVRYQIEQYPRDLLRINGYHASGRIKIPLHRNIEA